MSCGAEPSRKPQPYARVCSSSLWVLITVSRREAVPVISVPVIHFHAVGKSELVRAVLGLRSFWQRVREPEDLRRTPHVRLWNICALILRCAGDTPPAYRPAALAGTGAAESGHELDH